MKAFFAFGRMNPPTAGHCRVVEKLREEAKREGGVVRLYLSQSQDSVRNPLTPEQKVNFARKLFPDVDVRLSKTLFAATLDMAADGVQDGVMIVGEDRLEAFAKILEDYSGTKELGLRCAEAQAISRTESDASATNARMAAQNDDWATFCELSPTKDEKLTREIYDAVREGLGV
jgi:nicotinamide mononucleotide adenylyltransferase